MDPRVGVWINTLLWQPYRGKVNRSWLYKNTTINLHARGDQCLNAFLIRFDGERHIATKHLELRSCVALDPHMLENWLVQVCQTLLQGSCSIETSNISLTKALVWEWRSIQRRHWAQGKEKHLNESASANKWTGLHSLYLDSTCFRDWVLFYH